MADFAIQRGKLERAASTASATDTLGTSVSALSSAFAKLSQSNNYGMGPSAGTTNSLTCRDQGLELELTSTSVVTLRGYSASAVANEATYEVWEYTGEPGGANEFIVRHRELVSFSGGSTTADSSAITGITNIANCVAFVNGGTVSALNNQFDRIQIATEVINNGTNDVVRCYRGDGTGSPDAFITVVEFTGSNWTLWHYDNSDLSYTTIGSEESHTITDVGDWSKCHIHASAIAGTNDVDACGYLIYPGSSTTDLKTFRRETNFTHPYITIIKNSEWNIQHFGPTSYTTATAPQTIDISVTDVGDLGNTGCAVFNLVDAGAGSHPEEVMGAELTSTTNLRLHRNKSDEFAGQYTAQVIEFPAAADVTITVNTSSVIPTGKATDISESVVASSQSANPVGQSTDIAETVIGNTQSALPAGQATDIAETVLANISSTNPAGQATDIAETVLGNAAAVNPTGLNATISEAAPVDIPANTGSVATQGLGFEIDETILAETGGSIPTKLQGLITEVVIANIGDDSVTSLEAGIDEYLETGVHSVAPVGQTALVADVVVPEIGVASPTGQHTDINETLFGNVGDLGVAGQSAEVAQAIDFNSAAITPIGQSFEVGDLISFEVESVEPLPQQAIVDSLGDIAIEAKIVSITGGEFSIDETIDMSFGNVGVSTQTIDVSVLDELEIATYPVPLKGRKSFIASTGNIEGLSFYIINENKGHATFYKSSENYYLIDI